MTLSSISIIFPICFIFNSFLSQTDTVYQSKDDIYLNKKTGEQKRTFTIDFLNDTFLKDGKPFQYFSGSLLYARIPEIYWYDRLSKVKAGGLNTIQFYVPWNLHETEQGVFNFAGNANLDKFLTIARELELLVLLRSGPYMCGEWDFGGLPAWLLRENPNMDLRSSSADYLSAVLKWNSVLMPILKPHLYQNNGSIIMVQIENEYGSYFTCDSKYLRALYDNVRYHLGNDIIIYSTDGNAISYLVCGSSDRRVFSTVDFGTGGANNPQGSFSDLKKWQPRGPLVNSEYYTGWLDSWGRKHNTVETSDAVKGMNSMYNYSKSVNVNMYMYHGGTSFGFWNGANDPPFLPQISSYDYDAPLSEAGDTTYKYMAIRSYLKTINPDQPFPPVPPNTTKMAYGLAVLHQNPYFLTNLLKLNAYTSTYPVTMESLKQYQGYMVYLTSTSQFAKNRGMGTTGNIKFTRIGDNAFIFTSNSDNTEIKFQGKLDRNMKDLLLVVEVNENLIILIENAGHINFGRGMVNDVKGIIGNVTLNDEILLNWKHFPINLTNTDSDSPVTTPIISIPTQGGFFSTIFKLHSNPEDTFLKTTNFSKGVVLINDFNVGRYWNTRGPQFTLFIPKSVLNIGVNKMILFELEGTSCTDHCFVEFVDTPIIDGPVH